MVKVETQIQNKIDDLNAGLQKVNSPYYDFLVKENNGYYIQSLEKVNDIWQIKTSDD